jgi:F-type H+-transporting ATPase subunit epsilon
MKTLSVTILTPSGTLSFGEVDSLYVPSEKGRWGILPGHTSEVSALRSGLVALTSGSKTSYFVVDGGVCEVKPEITLILAERCLAAPSKDEAEQILRSFKAKAKGLSERGVSPDEGGLSSAYLSLRKKSYNSGMKKGAK